MVTTGELLYYPLEGLEEEPCDFYINPKDAKRLGSKSTISFVRCELVLSPLSERIKHKNPFSLCLKPGSGERLTYLPKDIPQEILVDPLAKENASQLISQAIYDFHFEKQMNGINDEINKIKENLERNLAKRQEEINLLLDKNTQILEEETTKKEEIKKSMGLS